MNPVDYLGIRSRRAFLRDCAGGIEGSREAIAARCRTRRSRHRPMHCDGATWEGSESAHACAA